MLAIAWAALAIQPLTSEPLKVAGVAVVAALLLPGTLATLLRRPALLAAAAAVLLSSCFALEPAAWIGSAARGQGALIAFSVLVLAAAASSLAAAERRNVRAGAAGLGALLAIYVLVQYAGLDPLSWQGAVERRPTATLSNATTLAGWLLLLLPVTLACAVEVEHGRRWLWLACALLQAAALLASGTRSAIAALALVAIGAWALRDQRSRRLAMVLLAAAGVSVLVLAAWRPASLQDRAHLWRSALTALASPHPLTDLAGLPDRHAVLRPWIGFGPDQQQPALEAAARSTPVERVDARGWSADRAHQMLLDRALEMGVIGLIAGLWLLLAVARALWRGWQSGDDGRRREALALGVALAAWLLHLQASFGLTGDRTLAWVWIGMALALGDREALAAPASRVWSLRLLGIGLAGGLLLGAAAAGGWLSPQLSARLAPALQAEREYAAGQAAYAQAVTATGAGASRDMAAAAAAFEHATALRRFDRDAALAAASARVELAAMAASGDDLARARIWADSVRRLAPADPRLQAVDRRIAAVAVRFDPAASR